MGLLQLTALDVIDETSAVISLRKKNKIDDQKQSGSKSKRRQDSLNRTEFLFVAHGHFLVSAGLPLQLSSVIAPLVRAIFLIR
jgi:hypothetical protein